MPEGHVQFARIMQRMQLTRHKVSRLFFLLLLGVFTVSSNSAWAMVGSVLVTAGHNKLEDASGRQSLIARGTKINNGDTVYTGAAGHLQIRFVDGAIVALRPNTDFRVDEYRYPAAPQRSFLSLLRGALRTATGLASKEDPENYRLTTPSATIGVRGTHFVAEETACKPRCAADEQAGLHVSVSEGAIIVANDAGTIELNAGQSARVTGPDAKPIKTAKAPLLSPRRYQPDQPPTPETINPAPTQLALGNPVQQSLQLPDNYEPTKQTQEARAESSIESNRVALGKEPASQTLPSNDTATPGIDGSDPAASSSPDGSQSNRDELNFGGDRASPGDWTIPGPGENGTFSPTRDTDNPSTQPSTPPLAEADLADSDLADRNLGRNDDFLQGEADYPGLAYLPAPVEQINLPRLPGGGFDMASLQPEPDRQFEGDLANDSGTPDNGNNTPGGNGDNGGDNPPVTPPIVSPAPAPGVAQAEQWRIDLRAVPIVSRIGLVLNNQAILAFDDEVTLTALGLCPNVFCLSRGTAIAAESGHDEFAAWGRWTDGSLSLRILGLETAIALGDRDGLHYLIGAPAVSLPAQGTFSYPLVGATAPTAEIGWAPGEFSGAASVQFAPGVAARVGLEGQIDIANERFSFSTNGGVSSPGQSQLSTNEQAGFSGTLASPGSPGAPWFCGSSGCAVNVNGGLLGPSGERLGLGYSVISESGSTTIEGVAVFGRP